MPSLTERVAPPLPLPLGGPGSGFHNSIDAAEVGPGAMVEGSRDFLLDNNERKLIRRKGLTNFGGTAGILETGITYNTYTFRGTQLSEFRSRALGPNFDVSLGALLTSEVDSSTAYGAFSWFDPTAGAFKGIMQTADSDFPTNVKPFAFIGGNRMGASAAGATVPGDRIKFAAGSRGFIDQGDALYFPSFGTDDGRGIPSKWLGKRYPASGIAAERVERLHPTGLMPPLWMPRIGFTNVALGANEKANWLGKYGFYISCLFIRDDGAWGPPCVPRPPTSILNTTGAGHHLDMSPVAVGGYGLIRLSATTTDTARIISWSGIPTPPPGYKEVVLLRSPCVDHSTGAMPDPSDLRVVAILPAGQTTYTDPHGPGATLGEEPIEVSTKVRFTHIWPPRARYIAHGADQRAMVSYVRDTPCAILVTPRGSTSTADEFNDDDEATPSITPRAYIAIIDAGASIYLDLVWRESTATNIAHRRRLLLNDYTLEELVDRINSGALGANDLGEVAKRWHAQLVPGANGVLKASSAAGSGENLLLFGAAEGVGTAFDDESWTTAAAGCTQIGNSQNVNMQRVFGPGWPGLCLYSAAYLSTRPILKNGLAFTRGGPGETANSADSWDFQNQMQLPGRAGSSMGIVPLLDGALLPGTQQICIWRNIKDGKSGADADYRIGVIDPAKGCISPAMAAGPGFAVVLTEHGLIAYDEVTGEGLPISLKLYNPSARSGELAYEIGECAKATSRDTRLAVGGGATPTDYFSVAIGESKIKIGYRTSASYTVPNRWLEMDFSPGKEQRGIAALLDPQSGEPWGWSAPCLPKDDVDPGAGTQSDVAFSCFTLMRGDIAGTSAFKWYGIRDKHVSGAVEGRVDELDIHASQDNGTDIGAVAVTMLQKPGAPRQRHRAKRVIVDWRCSDAACTLEHSRSGGAYGSAVSLGASGTNRDSEVVPLTLSQRGPALSSQQRFTDPGTGARAELWGMLVDVELVDTGVV